MSSHADVPCYTVQMGGPTFKQALHKATSDLGEMLARQQTQEQQQPDEVCMIDVVKDVLRTASNVGQPPEKKTRTGSQGSIVQGAADLENTAGQEAASMEDEEEASIGMQHCGGVSNWRAAGAVKLPPYSLHLGHEGCTQPPVSHLPPLEVFLVKFMMAPGGGQPVIITGTAGVSSVGAAARIGPPEVWLAYNFDMPAQVGLHELRCTY
eukprot:scaffold84062_cov19-Tisochrysis_lutea.AAC.3